MCKVLLEMPVDTPHSNFGVWPIYVLEGLCTTGARCCCICQWTLPTPISGLGGIMCCWGKAPLYIPADVPHSNFGAWRAYVLLGQGTTVHASGFPPLQFGVWP